MIDIKFLVKKWLSTELTNRLLVKIVFSVV